MKHQHQIDGNHSFDIPTQDLEDLIDKITDSAVTIIVIATVASIVKARLGR